MGQGGIAIGVPLRDVSFHGIEVGELFLGSGYIELAAPQKGDEGVVVGVDVELGVVGGPLFEGCEGFGAGFGGFVEDFGTELTRGGVLSHGSCEWY